MHICDITRTLVFPPHNLIASKSVFCYHARMSTNRKTPPSGPAAPSRPLPAGGAAPDVIPHPIRVNAANSVDANRTALPPPSGADGTLPGGSAARSPTGVDVPLPGGSSERTPSGELAAWLAKYAPVERAILEARERRLRNRAARRAKEARRFGDLCEASEGLAVAWRRRGFPAGEMLDWAGGDRLALWAAAPFLRRCATEEVNALRRRLVRPLYYGRENARRRALAAERRRVRRRRTESPCPTREAILDAWTHAREGREAMLRFGSLLEDLACYVDHGLRLAGGRIVGRAPGIKGWLRENVPALALRYTTVMRYKAAAKKLRQVVELPDPIPVAAVLDGAGVGVGAKDSAGAGNGTGTVDGAGAPEGTEPKEGKRDYGAEKSKDNVRGRSRTRERLEARAAVNGVEKQKRDYDAERLQCGASVDEREAEDARERREAERETAVLRARGVYLEAMEGVPDVVTRVLERIDALLDPRRVEEATMLASWRARYARAVTGRTAARWRDRLFRRVG